jgi:hypothetical protein
LLGPIGRGTRRTTARSLNPADRRCPGCGTDRKVEEFTRDRSKSDGFGSYCLSCDRERSRVYYARNREKVLAKAAARRGPRPARFCSECGVELEGRSRVCCGSAKCREQRFRRLQPEAYAERERKKVVRRRERRRELRGREAATGAGVHGCLQIKTPAFRSILGLPADSAGVASGTKNSNFR